MISNNNIRRISSQQNQEQPMFLRIHHDDKQHQQQQQQRFAIIVSSDFLSTTTTTHHSRRIKRTNLYSFSSSSSRTRRRRNKNLSLSLYAFLLTIWFLLNIEISFIMCFSFRTTENRIRKPLFFRTTTSFPTNYNEPQQQPKHQYLNRRFGYDTSRTELSIGKVWSMVPNLQRSSSSNSSMNTKSNNNLSNNNDNNNNKDDQRVMTHNTFSLFQDIVGKRMVNRNPLTDDNMSTISVPFTSPRKSFRTSSSSSSSSGSSSTGMMRNSNSLIELMKGFRDKMVGNNDRVMSQAEMITMTATGAVLTFGVLYILASDGGNAGSSILDGIGVGGSGGSADTSELTYLIEQQGLTTTTLDATLGSSLEVASFNILDAAMPLTYSDVVAVSIGEAIASVIGTLATLTLSLGNQLRLQNTKVQQSQSQQQQQQQQVQSAMKTPLTPFSNVLQSMPGMTSPPPPSSSMMTMKSNTNNNNYDNPVADGDFLLTQSAAFPLLLLLGLNPVVATITSIGLAMVPYSFLKITSRQRAIVVEETEYLNLYLREQLEYEEMIQKKKRNGIDISLDWLQKLQVSTTSVTNPMTMPMTIPSSSTIPLTPTVPPQPTTKVRTTTSNQFSQMSIRTSTGVGVDPGTLIPIQDTMNSTVATFDFVEFITDVTKWLQYNVLKSDFGNGKLRQLTGIDMGGGALLALPLLTTGEESALFGAIATISSQFYSDILYGYCGFGGEQKTNMVRSRSVTEWVNLYASKAFYSAALFGVYAMVQSPATESVNAIISGGVSNCYGSDDVRLCIQTYVDFNPPGPSFEAQLRSFITAAYSSWNHVVGGL